MRIVYKKKKNKKWEQEKGKIVAVAKYTVMYDYAFSFFHRWFTPKFTFASDLFMRMCTGTYMHKHSHIHPHRSTHMVSYVQFILVLRKMSFSMWRQKINMCSAVEEMQKCKEPLKVNMNFNVEHVLPDEQKKNNDFLLIISSQFVCCSSCYTYFILLLWYYCCSCTIYSYCNGDAFVHVTLWVLAQHTINENEALFFCLLVCLFKTRVKPWFQYFPLFIWFWTA